MPRIFSTVTVDLMQVAILNGVTMGGGGGVSIPGTFRIATDKTVCDRVPSTYNYSFVLLCMRKSQITLQNLRNGTRDS